MTQQQQQQQQQPIPGFALFGRDWQLVTDNLDVSALDFSFHCSSTLKSEPNKTEIKIYNLSTDHVAQLERRVQPIAGSKKIQGIHVELEAGYVGYRGNIFRGDLREIATVWDGPDRVTTIAGHDGGRSYKYARVNLSYGPGTPCATVLRDLATAMGVGYGNTDDAAKIITIPGLGNNYAHGTTVNGNVALEMDRLCKSAGLQWTIQKGVLQFQQAGQPLQTSALRIADDTGLIGSPAPDIDASVAQPGPDAKASGAPKKPKTHLITFDTLLIVGLYPGRKVVLDSTDYKGGYVLTQVDYIGDTATDDWTAKCKARAY